MATVVYQSYFESQHFEPRALRLKLSSPSNPHSSTPFKSQNSSITPLENSTPTFNAVSLSSSEANSKSSSGSWSFLESLSNSNEKEKKSTLSLYQSPSSRRTLSDESLALCTESLGSETGSDIIHEDEDLFSVSSQTIEARTTPRISKQVKKRNVMASLPPPLTSMRGLDCIEVKSHRENGRLVMRAARPLPRNRCLQDRSNGCVRLAILVDSDDLIETESNEEEEEEETIESVRDNEEEEEEETIESVRDNEEEEEEEEEETIESVRDNEEEEIQAHEEEEIQAYEHEEVKSVEKVQRSRRCIEGERENRGFLNWESFCVATS